MLLLLSQLIKGRPIIGFKDSRTGWYVNDVVDDDGDEEKKSKSGCLQSTGQSNGRRELERV